MRRAAAFNSETGFEIKRAINKSTVQISTTTKIIQTTKEISVSIGSFSENIGSNQHNADQFRSQQYFLPHGKYIHVITDFHAVTSNL